MKRKKFWLIFAVLTVMCVLAMGALVGCGEKHEHTYTKWANDEAQHWLVCPDDNAKDENSVSDHEFGTDGKCVECGYEKPHTHAYTKWRTSDTEHWKVCPEDNQEQAGSRAPHNFVNGECECGKKDGFTGEVTVDEKYNGKTVTLKREGQTDALLTIANGKVTLTNVKFGEWSAVCNFMNIDLKTAVTIEEGMKELDLSGFWANEGDKNTADINFATGELKWYRLSHKTAKVELAQEATGNQFVSVKITTADDFLDWANKYDEMNFGIAMTVNGTTHSVNFNWRNWQHDQIGFSTDVKTGDFDSRDRYRGCAAVTEHLFKPKFSGFGNGWEFGTYGGAIIDGGLYFVLQYEAATGNAKVYLSDGETYMLVHTEEELFEKNGKLQGFGLVEGDKDNGWSGGEYPGTADREFTFTLGYGTTMNAAVSDDVSEWKSTVNITGNKTDFEGAEVTADKTAYGYGETATITVTVPANKIATVTVDNGTPVVLEESGEVTINAINKLQYTVNVVFANDKFTGEVAVDSAYNGKTLTLKKDGQSDINLTVADGKVTLTNVKLGEWTAICNLLGMNLKTTVTLNDGMTSLDLSGFLAGTANINIDTGAFVYQQNKENSPNVDVNLAEGVSGDAYVSLKLSTDSAKGGWTNEQFEEIHLGVWMTVGGAKHWVELHWRNWENAHFGIHSDTDHGNKGEDVLKANLWQPIEGFSFENHGWDMNAYGEAFMADGIYLVMKYDSATGNVDVLLAKSDGYVKVCTFEGMFEAGQQLTAFGVGTIGEDYGYHNCPGGFKIDCVLNYGTTLGGATGEQITEEPKA